MKKNLLPGLLATVLAFGLIGCEQQKGPAEEAGAAIDDAIGQAGEKLEQAGEELRQESGN
jgi:hypothetical protein